MAVLEVRAAMGVRCPPGGQEQAFARRSARTIVCKQQPHDLLVAVSRGEHERGAARLVGVVGDALIGRLRWAHALSRAAAVASAACGGPTR